MRVCHEARAEELQRIGCEPRLVLPCFKARSLVGAPSFARAGVAGRIRSRRRPSPAWWITRVVLLVKWQRTAASDATQGSARMSPRGFRARDWRSPLRGSAGVCRSVRLEALACTKRYDSAGSRSLEAELRGTAGAIEEGARSPGGGAEDQTRTGLAELSARSELGARCRRTSRRRTRVDAILEGCCASGERHGCAADDRATARTIQRRIRRRPLIGVFKNRRGLASKGTARRGARCPAALPRDR